MIKFLALFSLLIGGGCTALAPAPPGPPALADADFDGWRDAAAKPDPQPAQGPIIDDIVHSVLKNVDSVDAQIHFKQTAGAWQQTVEPLAKPEPLSARTFLPAASAAVAGPPLTAVSKPSSPFPPPAPPAEPLADAGGAAGSVETLDIPNGWTGAAVYHAATCQHCPALLAGLKSRASKVSGNYLRIDTPAACWFLLVDWDQRPDVNRPAIGGLPAVLYFVNGHERVGDRVIGFGNRPGELDAIIGKHPLNPKRGA